MTTALLPTCRICGVRFIHGEEADASDWKVLTDAGWRMMTRYQHPTCTSPAGSPTPTMDPSERANGGPPVASRTGTGPAGEAATTDLAAHLDTRLATLTPAQRTIAARHLQGACTLLNLTRNTSQAAWLNAVDEACEFGAAS